MPTVLPASEAVSREGSSVAGRFALHYSIYDDRLPTREEFVLVRCPSLYAMTSAMILLQIQSSFSSYWKPAFYSSILHYLFFLPLSTPFLPLPAYISCFDQIDYHPVSNHQLLTFVGSRPILFQSFPHPIFKAMRTRQDITTGLHRVVWCFGMGIGVTPSRQNMLWTAHWCFRKGYRRFSLHLRLTYITL